MNRVDLAPARALPADGAGVGSRRSDASGSFEEADAGFLQELAIVAADGQPEGFAANSKSTGEATIARWWHRQAGPEISLQPRGPDAGVEPTSPLDVLTPDATEVDTALLLSDATVTDPASSEASLSPASGAQPPQPAQVPSMGQVMAAAGAVIAPPLPSAAPAQAPVLPTTAEPRTDPQQRPAQPELPPVAANSTVTAPVTVTVVRSETHLAPVMQATPMWAMGKPLPGKPVAAERAGEVAVQPTEDVAAEPLGEVVRGKSGQPLEDVGATRIEPTVPRGQGREQPLAHVAADLLDAETPHPDADGGDTTSAALLPARGVPHGAHVAGSPVQQIADTIAAELASPAADPRHAAAPRTAPGLHPIKVLTIQLQPADLGTVTVRLTLRADGMEVQVEADQRTAARAIEADRERLTGALRSAGYHVEALTVRAVDLAAAPSSANANASTGSSDSGPQLQPGGREPDARTSGGRGQSESRNHAHMPDRSLNEGEQASGGRRDAGLYV